MLPVQRITWLIFSVAYPIYARLQESPERLVRAFNLALSFILRLSLPLAVVLTFTIPELTVLLIGEKWLPLVSVFRVLTVYAFLRPLLDDAGSLLTALGELRAMNNIQFVQVGVVLAIGPLLMYRYGATGATIFMDVSVAVGVVMYYRRLRRHVRVSYGQVFVAPVIATAVGSAVLGFAADG